MNYKSISFIVLAGLAFVSCKKEEAVDKPKHGYVIMPENSQASKTIDPNAKYAVMGFEATHHDFGTIKPTGKAEKVFTFTNTGEADLIISDAKASCGCTVPEFPKEPIVPGGKGSIKVVFNPMDRTGLQNKSVTLTTNTAIGKEKLTIKANIVE